MQKVILNESRTLALLSAAEVKATCRGKTCLFGPHSAVSFGLVWFGFDGDLHIKGVRTSAETTELQVYVV